MSENQQSPAPPVFPHGASEEGNEVREACSDVITSVCQLKDIIDVSPDDADEEHRVATKYIHVLSAIADLTQAVVAYIEPENIWQRAHSEEPY